MNLYSAEHTSEVGESQNQVSVIDKACLNDFWGIWERGKMEAFSNHIRNTFMKHKEKYSWQCRRTERGCGGMCPPPDTEHSNWITTGLDHFNRCTGISFIIALHSSCCWMATDGEGMDISAVSIHIIPILPKMSICMIKIYIYNMMHFQSAIMW